MENISVLIPTCGRLQLLARCLSSLKKQTVLPSQIVVVDNSSTLGTEKIVENFKKHFQIVYAVEKEKGEAFARNKALKLAEGGILVFIDDDCVADKNWLKNILFCFKNEFKCDGVLGKSENYLKDNPFACIYQCYYLRWLMENFQDIDRVQPLTERNSYFDTKNLAVKRNLVNNFSFDPNILFHSINVDNIAGDSLLKKGYFFYNPKIIVYHQNWDSLKNLLKKNFYQGIADQLILEKHKVDPRKKVMRYSLLAWLKMCSKEIKGLNIFKRIFFWTLLFIYPVPYRIGRLAYKFKR